MKVIYVSANLLALLIGDIPESSFHKFQAGCQTEITVLPFLVRVYKLKARALASWLWLEITTTVDCRFVFVITSFSAAVHGLDLALLLKLLNSTCNKSRSALAGRLSESLSLLILALSLRIYNCTASRCYVYAPYKITAIVPIVDFALDHRYNNHTSICIDVSEV